MKQTNKNSCHSVVNLPFCLLTFGRHLALEKGHIFNKILNRVTIKT